MTAKIRHLICLLLSAAVLVCISCSLAEGTEVSTFVHHLSGPLNPSIPLKPVPLTPAEDLKPLPMGIRVKGMPLKLEHISEDFKEYEDSSIHAVVTVDYVEYEDFKGKGYTNCHIVRITVADGSQVRSGISYDDFDGDRLVRARMLAENCNAVAAVNGDFFKSTTTRGYIFRQGSFFRDKANAERDVLLIDSEGDFHVIEKATGKTIEQAMQELPEGVSAVNVFNFGPALVDHGKVTDIASSTTGLAENKDDSFYYQYRNPRVAVVQLGSWNTPSWNAMPRRRTATAA